MIAMLARPSGDLAGTHKMKNDDFYPGMKVALNGENGIVLDTERNEAGKAELHGVIRWDTEKEEDDEDWRGMFGSFIESGGKILDPEFEFTHLQNL